MNSNPFVAEWAHLKPNQYCALEVTPYGTHVWHNAAGQRHRVDENGIQDGPASIWSDGNQFWYLNGKLHRLDGPACIYSGETQFWCLDGKGMTQEEWTADARVIAHHSQTPEEAEEWLKRL